jgi:hypothetical protein
MLIWGEVAASIENSTSTADSNGDKRLRSADAGRRESFGCRGLRLRPGGCDRGGPGTSTARSADAARCDAERYYDALPGRLRPRMARR